MPKYTLNFIDLFDWEKENDLHYYQLLHGPITYEEFQEQKAASIEIIHDETNPEEEYDNDQADEGTL